jgi:P4 family phage/plasmid primase-like protien
VREFLLSKSMTTAKTLFLDMFPDHQYRYIDQTGEGRPPVSSSEKKPELNVNGYESYFTVNGFRDAPNAQKENCSSLNAFFVDIDGRKDEKELDEIKKKLDPTFITETKNGYHIYWLLDEPIYKDELSPLDWESSVAEWEQIEQSVVDTIKADPVVKDVPRILRVPDTYYWKKTGDAYKKGTAGVLKIKWIYKNFANTYSMKAVSEAFPTQLKLDKYERPIESEKALQNSKKETQIFFERANALYPIEQRPSFQALISGKPETLPVKYQTARNKALLITASLMKQAGWSQEKAMSHFANIGWHGIEKERGGLQEIASTVDSAFKKGYTYAYKNEVIAHNMTSEELEIIQKTYNDISKERKELDKVRFSTYEKEIFADHPHFKKNAIGIVYDYHNGVYREVSDQQLSGIMLNGLYDDMLWSFRTKRNVADKVACLLSIIPDFQITPDHGRIANVKNGLLDIYTRELRPHTPEFVSLIQYPVEYHPEATCPIWEKCLDAWMDGPEKAEKTRLLQQFCGYILSSSMLYDRALFMVGDGGNGKSTFIDTISMIIGRQATSHIDLESLYGTFGMDGLVGKRLNIIEEVHGNYYQSNKLKKLISGEQVTIDRKYKDQFTFRPQCKFVFAVNQMPRVDDTSTATERRICAVTFLNNFRLNPNTKLRSETGQLYTELSGILNWMIAGANDLIEAKNFVVTAEQTQMLKDYREENSSVEGFLAECIAFEPSESIETPVLYSEFKKWCLSDGGRKPKSKITFNKEVKAFGYKNGKFTYEERASGHSEARFVGIKLNPLWTQLSTETNNAFNQM